MDGLTSSTVVPFRSSALFHVAVRACATTGAPEGLSRSQPHQTPHHRTKDEKSHATECCDNAGVFTALLEGLIAEAARQGKTDLSLVSVDSTTARAHHDATGMTIGKDVMEALEKAATEQEQAREGGDKAEQNGRDGENEPERTERRSGSFEWGIKVGAAPGHTWQ